MFTFNGRILHRIHRNETSGKGHLMKNQSGHSGCAPCRQQSLDALLTTYADFPENEVKIRRGVRVAELFR
jgi:hypothetical protein